MKKKSNFSITEIIIIVIVTGVVASLTTGIIIFSSYKYSGMGEDKALQEFINVYAKVVDKYYEEVDKQGMVDSAINGMMKYLGDNYSIYMNDTEADSLTSQLSGEYKGIGISIKADNVIAEVFSDSPAMKAGIMAGDKVLAVDGVTVNNSTETVALIGNNDTVKIKLQRGDDTFEVSVTSKTIDKPVVTSDIFTENDKKIGYLAISSFTKNVDTQFEKKLKEVEDQGIDALIIDVRYNSGGYLDKTENILNMFLEKGKLIYSLRNKDNTKSTYDKTGEKREYSVAILMNEATASASEVLAAALKDSYGAILVGKRSYGKGKVQQTMDLGDGSLVKYTTAEWLRPTGECIDEVGIVPDIEIDNQIIGDGQVEDLQLAKAIETLAY